MWRTALLLAALCVLYSSRYGRSQGVLVGRYISPPSGSTVYELAGGDLTFNCTIVNNQTLNQSISQWRIGATATGSLIIDVTLALGGENVEYDGRPLSQPSLGITNYRSILTIRNFSRDSQILQCFSGSDVLAEFFLFLYRPVTLVNFTTLSVVSGADSITINMEDANVTAFPFPSFNWMFDNSPAMNSTAVTFGYPTITFQIVDTTFSGSYSLFATNYFLDEPTRVLGSSTGGFTLDVLFGPSIRRGDSQRAVELGAPLSLLCGDQLMSNPLATITWQDPRGGVVMDNALYDLVNDVTGVRLNFTNTTLSDNGQWTCNVTVTGRDVTVRQNMVAAEVEVGHIQYEIDVFVVDVPSPPTSLSVEIVGGTWALLDWVHPSYMGLQGTSLYVATAVDIDDDNLPPVSMSTQGNGTDVNMTNLLPVVRYSFSVQAVSIALAVEIRSQPSNVENGTTLTTAPAPVCASVSPTNEGLQVSYIFIHTGGLELTRVNITYTMAGSSNAREGPTVGVSDRQATITNLVAGYTYTVAVTAANLNRSTTVACLPATVSAGFPQPPSQPMVAEVSGNTVSVKIRSSYPGSSSIYVVVTPILVSATGETAGDRVRLEVQNYRSGEEVEVLVPDLVTGSTYRFQVEIGNRFGMAMSSVLSGEFTIRGNVLTFPPPGVPTSSGSNAGAIAGGVIAAVVVVVIVVVVVVIIVVLLTRNRRDSYRPTKIEIDDDRRCSSPPGDKGSMDIGTEIEPPAPTKPKEIMYVELDSLMPLQSATNGNMVEEPKPIKRSVPTVEYASIDTFKREPVKEATPNPQNNSDEPSTEV